MRRKIDYVLAILLLVLGTIHTVLTPVFFKTFDLNALWFVGTGLAFIFLGFINVSRIRTTEMFIKKLCMLGNALALVYCILIVIKMAKPQAFISLIDLLILFCLSFIDLRLSKDVN